MKSRVSVVMATYNHAPFVAEAVESVLMQEGVAFEFLAADDGSSDHTAEIVGGYSDPRLTFTAHRVNRGAGVVTNELIERAESEFVALINSDDRWVDPDKLAVQVAYLDEHPSKAATFGRARFIDHEGRPLPKASVPAGDVFDQRNRSQGAWMRHFFDHGNCLCHPTMLIRRQCYEVLGPYDNRLRQLPDFEMWIRLVKRFDIHVSSRELIAFRHLPGENASAVTAANSRRAIRELYFILRRFFDDTPTEILRDGFGDRLVLPDLSDETHTDIEKALLFRSNGGNGSYIRDLIALEKLHDLLGSPAHRRVLRDDYSLDDRAFQAFTGEDASGDGLAKDVLEAQVQDLLAALRAVENSLSWRVTAPLRRLARVTRRR